MTGDSPANGGPDPKFIVAMIEAAFERGDLERAIRHGDRYLAISPDSPEALVWAIRLRLKAKRWQEAFDLGAAATESHEEIPGMLGQALEGLGRLEDAQSFYDRACVRQPENPSWHFLNASVLSRLHREFESMERLRRAVEILPDPAGLLILADQELTFGNPAGALIFVDRSLALEPKSAKGHALAAKCLMALGRHEEAEGRWKAAFALDPGNERLRLQRAVALDRHGEFEKAVESLNQVITGNPRSVQGYAQFATAKRLSPEDRPLMDRMEKLLEDKSLEEKDRIALGIALGKSYDNLHEYEKAMGHFNEANRIQFQTVQRTGGFDREAYAADIALREQVYSRQTIGQYREGNPSEMPIFVLGMIRSGTTLAEQILSAHPSVVGAGEQDHWITTDLRLIDKITGRLFPQTLRESGNTYLRILDSFAKGVALRVVDKQPGNLLLAGALHMAFPNARIIHMRRHPADTAISIWTTYLRTSARFVFDKGNISFALQAHENLMNHWRKVIPSDRFLEVSYESLIDDREKMTRQILSFCGLPWDEACLFPERNQKVVTTPSLWQVRQPVYRTSIGRWKNYEPWLGEFRSLLGQEELKA